MSPIIRSAQKMSSVLPSYRSHRLLAYQPPAAMASTAAAAPAPAMAAYVASDVPEPSPGLAGASPPLTTSAMPPTDGGGVDVGVGVGSSKANWQNSPSDPSTTISLAWTAGAV